MPTILVIVHQNITVLLLNIGFKSQIFQQQQKKRAIRAHFELTFELSPHFSFCKCSTTLNEIQSTMRNY